jgi:hypothetical protein
MTEKAKQRDVIGKILKTFRKNDLQATVGDIIGETNLSVGDIETTMPVVLRNYRGHVKVSESGDILYYFPEGLTDREEGLGAKVGQFFRSFWKGVTAVAAFLFKAWIVVMLVGYFVLFIGLLVLSLALSAAGNSRGSSRSSSRGGGFLAGGLFRIMINLWLYSGLQEPRRSMMRGVGIKKRKIRPFHIAVFEYVFGPKRDPKKEGEQERNRLIQQIRSKKGLITTEEVMAFMGQNRDEANNLINSLLVQYQGEPKVTPGGGLYYQFDQLQKTTTSISKEAVLPVPTLKRDSNPKTTNTWIVVINSVNLLFSAFFLGYGFGAITDGPLQEFGDMVVSILNEFLQINDGLSLLVIGLGFVPLIYSALFFTITFLRRYRDQEENRRREARNLTGAVLSKVLQTEGGFSPEEFLGYQRKPKAAKIIDSTIKDLGTGDDVQVEKTTLGYAYKFQRLNELKHEMEDIRDRTVLKDIRQEETAFDSGERL